MTDPRIVTDADTVARLSKKAKAISKILGDDDYAGIVMVEPKDGDGPWIACVGEADPNAHTWIAVAIEGGDVWHYDPDTDTGTPQAAPVVVTVHPSGDRCNDDMGGAHFTDFGGACVCLGGCCNNAAGGCTCRWGCTDEGHGH